MSIPTSSFTRQTIAAMRALCAGLIDYAGLFPPAELPMAPAVANYAAYRRGVDCWLLGRFILPVTRLAEFEAALATVAATTTGDDTAPGAANAAPWRLSALVATPPDRLATDLDQIASFNARHASAPGATPTAGVAQVASIPAMIDTIETKAQTADEIAGIAQTLAAWQAALPDLAVYVELPLGDATPALIKLLAGAGLRGKVRTGGVTADAFPSAAALAAFLAACDAADLPFKATAGLHHAIRATYRLTYAPDSPSATMYGFLNVFFAAAFLADGASLADAERILREADQTEFCFDDSGVVWRDHRLTTEQLERTRQSFAISYGSCSFEEPVAHLKAMGLL